MLSFDGEFQIGSVFDGEYEFHSSFDGELFVGEVITAEEHEIYHGQTTVVPLVETSTTLHTENKIIKEDHFLYFLHIFLSKSYSSLLLNGLLSVLDIVVHKGLF